MRTQNLIVLYVNPEAGCPFGVGLSEGSTTIEWRLTILEALEVCDDFLSEGCTLHPKDTELHSIWEQVRQKSAA